MSRVVMTVTPVTKVPNARRRAIGSIGTSAFAAVSAMLSCLLHLLKGRLSLPVRRFFLGFEGVGEKLLLRSVGQPATSAVKPQIPAVAGYFSALLSMTPCRRMASSMAKRFSGVSTSTPKSS